MSIQSHNLNIVYCCNDKYFEIIYLSILSIIKRTTRNIHFYIITADLTSIKKEYKQLSFEHIQILDDLIKRFNSNNAITLLDATDMYFSAFEKNKDIFRFTPYAMLRLFIPHFDCFSDIVLYLDGDTLANNDISYAFDVDMHGYEMCVSKDLIHSEVINDGTMIFNTGVLLINVDYIRKTKCFDAAIQFYLKYRPDMIDQACLNATCKQIKRWHNDERFNYQRDGVQDDTIIKHFFYPMSYIEDLFYIKPDNIKKVQNLLNLHNWDEDFEFFLNQKRNWK